MISSPEAEQAVGAVLKNPKHPAFAAMWKALADRAYGKAPQPLTGEGGTGPVAIAITRRIVDPAAPEGAAP